MSQTASDAELNDEGQSPERSRSRSPIRRSRSRSHSRGRDDRRPRRITLISKRVVISNVPYEMKWQDIKDIFRKEVGEVQYVEMWETGDGKSRGSGIIEFKDKDTARKAIETMHRYKMKDRNIVVREERESDQSMGGRQGGGGGMGGGFGGSGIMGNNMGGGGGMMGNMGGGMMGNMGGSGGISPQVLQQLGIDGPLCNTVFVSNLDYKVNWKKLKDVFKLAGNVRRAEIKQDKDGKSRGMGTVSFENNVEAVQAISMFNNQTLYDRPMRVKLDSASAPPAEKPKPMNLPRGLKSIGMGLGAGGIPMQNAGTGNMGGSMGMSGGSGMGGSMGNMGGMGNMDGGMGMGNSGMGNMGNMGTMSGMGMSGMGGSGMTGTGMGMGGMSNTGMSGMGMTGGMNDNFGSGMGNTGYGTTSLSGMGDQRMGMNNNSMSTSNFGTSMVDNMGGNSNFGLGGSSYSNYGTGSSSFGTQDRGRDRERETRPDNCTIVCKNLPYALKWQDLKEKFNTCGEVKFAEIKMENGRSAGWGLVRFGNSEDAQRAITMMNRSRIDGREVDVKLYR